MSGTLVRIFLGLFLASVVAFGAGRLVPRLLASLTAPLCLMRRNDNGDERPYDRVIQVSHLLGVYFAVAFLFSIAGWLFDLYTQHDRSTDLLPAELLSVISFGALLGCVFGLLLVATARIEAIAHSTVLANALQSVLIGAPALAAFFLICSPKLLTWAADTAKYRMPDLVGIIFVCAFIVGGTVELLAAVAQKQPHFGPFGFRLVPYELVRQRIEEWETAEQIWDPRSIPRWTVEAVREAKGWDIRSIGWLTTTHPKDVLDELLAIHRRVRMDPKTPGVRIIIPRYAVERFLRDTEECRDLRDVTRVLRSDAAPRIRLLVMDTRKAVIHLPVGHNRNDRTLSSNYAAILTDPARVSEVRNWFEAIWSDAEDLGDAILPGSKPAG